MAINDIKISPTELLSQAENISKLSDGYKATMKQVEKVLKQVNADWSKNLSNSFTTKITTVMKSGNNLTTLLDTSATAAITAAESYSTMDKELSKLMFKDEGFVEKAKDSLSELVEEQVSNFDSMVDSLDYLYDLFENKLTEDQQDALKVVVKALLGGDNYDTIKIVLDMISGNSDLDTLKDAVKMGVDAFSNSSVESKLIYNTFIKISKYSKIVDDYNKKIIDAVDDGEFGIAAGYLFLEFSHTIGGGLVDVTFNAGLDLLDSALHLSDISDIVALFGGPDFMENFKDFSKNVGNSISEWLFG